MASHPVLRHAQTLLALLDDVGQGSTADREASLAAALDRLVTALHDAPAGELTRDVEPPPHDYEAERTRVGERFPRFGLYVAGGQFAPGGEPELEIADAIDDLADIAGALRDALWIASRAGEADALWALHAGFATHWGLHLRSLQLYLEMTRTHF